MTAPPPTVSRSDIAGALRELGLRAGDLVLAHSSLSSFGRVEGGADAVIDAFLDVLGAEGTLALPTLCQRDIERRFETWDTARSPSDVGRITEVFRLRPGVLRSDHPTHSVAACGRLAGRVTSGHATSDPRPGPWGERAFGRQSPWQAFYDLNARIVFVGVTMQVNTMGHFVEHLVAERALGGFPVGVRAEKLAGSQGWNRPGVWPAIDRTRLQAEFDARGMLRRATCGNASLLVVEAKPMVETALKVVLSAPEAWLNDEYLAWLGGPAAHVDSATLWAEALGRDAES